MTDLLQFPAAATVRPPRCSRYQLLAGAVTVGVIVTAAVLALVGRDHHVAGDPHKIASYPLAGVGDSGLRVGRPGYYDDMIVPSSVFPAHGEGHGATIDVRSVRPLFRVNDARARVSVKTCAQRRYPVLQFIDPHDACIRLTPFTPGRQRYSEGPGSADIVLVVTPRVPGRIRIQGVEVTYRDGLRTFHTHTGVSLNLRATAG